MISILSSKQYYTYIAFYLIVSENFKEKNIKFIESLYDQYDYFNITFIRIDDRYNKAYISRYITKQAYYRFSLGELIPYLNRIIYLDTDTLILKDLNKLYNTNFNGKIILGQITIFNRSKRTGNYNINSGILLLNLQKMRKVRLEKKILNIINKGFKSNFHDQALINHYLNKYIGLFPPEYHARPTGNRTKIIEFNNKSGRLFDNDYFYFSWKYPSIRHYVAYSKPMYTETNNIEDWWYFARKSKYYKRKTFNITNIFNFSYQ